MNFDVFEVGDIVKISPNSKLKAPMGVKGVVREVVKEEGSEPYIVDWEDGTWGHYGTLDLVKEENSNDEETEKERVVPLFAVQKDKKEESKITSKDAINKMFDEYKDYFDKIVIVGSSEGQMELFFAGLEIEEAHFNLTTAALQLASSGTEWEGE